MIPADKHAEKLRSEEYVRQRMIPDLSDNYYIHLSDLRLFLEAYAQAEVGRLLDYGCGGSPYKQLFETPNYLRADYIETENLDYKIGNDGKLPVADNSFDTIISTQVLEHVRSPQKYLEEAYRALRPEGRIILTTHGIWEDHGCPYDFRRWTADGLRLELTDAGFAVQRLDKLTTGPRAITFLFAEQLKRLRDSRKKLSGWAWWLLKQSSFNLPAERHNWMDRIFARNRVVSAEVPGHGLYLALGIEATKPVGDRASDRAPNPVGSTL